MAEEKDLKDLETIEAEARAKAEAEAMTAKASADRQNLQETTDLMATQGQELAAINTYNKAQYDNLGQIVSDVQGKIDAAKQKDAVAQKRENAFRYISGLGDTLSSVANLVGTAHGASNQQQVYNSNMVAQKAEEARKARKIEMEDLNTRLDEMKARQRDLKAAGSLQEAQIGVQHQKEQMALKSQQEEKAREAAYKERMLEIDKINAEANLKRAEASETNAETNANKPTKPSSPKKEHNFELAGGERITIPDHKWTDTAITSVYSSIPEELRTRRQRMRKNIAGIDEPEVDASGKPVYHTPTKQEMLNDIVALAKTNEDVANALRRYAKGAVSGANDPEFE